MTVGKSAALAVAFVGAIALGVAIGPSMRDRLSHRDTHPAVQPAAASAEHTPAPVEARKRASVPRARTNTAAKPEASVPNVTIQVSEPRLHDRLRPVLNRGAQMDIAADGFRSAEQFATVAHAARNTGVPFMVLKHRVVNEGRSLADAIHEAKPDIDAKAEVMRAQTEARSDLAAVAG
jgi:hypothetical protein